MPRLLARTHVFALLAALCAAAAVVPTSRASAFTQPTYDPLGFGSAGGHESLKALATISQGGQERISGMALEYDPMGVSTRHSYQSLVWLATVPQGGQGVSDPSNGASVQEPLPSRLEHLQVGVSRSRPLAASVVLLGFVAVAVAVTPRSRRG